MGNKTSIGWTQSDDGKEGATWNAMRGCSRTIAEGATQSGCGDASGGGCYAERNGWRFAGPGLPYEGLVRMTATGARWTGKVKLVDKHLLDPVRWTSPRRIFTTSVSDPFHERYTNETIAVVFGVMVITPHHIHQCLTKRAKRMREWFTWLEREAATCNGGVGMSPAAYCFSLLQRYVQHASGDAFRFTDAERKLVARGDLVEAACNAKWPLENVWLGVSCENQPATDERVPLLLKTPAAIRFLSCEPLIGPIDLENVRHRLGESSFETGSVLEGNDGFGLSAPRNAIDWVISGVESGPGARVCNVEWLRVLRDQCERAGVAHFLKQANEDLTPVVLSGIPQAQLSITVPTLAAGPSSKRKGADGTLIDLPYLDGKRHVQFPQVTHAA